MPEKSWANFEDIPVDKTFEYGTRYGISDQFESETMRMSIIRFDPGERGPLHYHNPPTEEYYVVLEGTLDISMDGEIVEADEGTVVLTSPETKHFPENNTDEPAVLLAVSAPNIDPSSEDGIVVVEDPN
jgi:mannose-6-phosphate isomerase-like protein (cupin superfamily)